MSTKVVEIKTLKVGKYIVLQVGKHLKSQV